IPAADIITAPAPVEIPRAVDTVLPFVPPPTVPAPTEDRQPAWAAVTGALAEHRPLLKWLALGAGAAILLCAAVAGGRALWDAMPSRPAAAPASTAAGAKPGGAAAAAKKT